MSARSVSLLCALLSLSAAACDDERGLSHSADPTAEAAPVGSVQMNLTLPDGAVLDALHYTVTRPLVAAPRTGFVQLENSTALRFRVGDLPVGNGYTIVIGGSTSAGTSCAGSVGFDVQSALVTALSMSLVCAPDAELQADDRGDVSATLDVRNASGEVCPVVTGVSGAPLQAALGALIALEGSQTSSAGATFAWTGPGGAFSPTDTSATSYRCASEGVQTLTYRVAKLGCNASAISISVRCGAQVLYEPVQLRGGADCARCLRTRCTNFETVNLVDPCFAGTNLLTPTADPEFAQKCTDAFVCSHNSSDGCGDNALGPYECYCGTGVPVDVCQTAFANVKGACIAQWTTATDCPVGEPSCVLGRFTDLTLPSGYANYLSQCQLEACNSACAD